MAPRLSAPVDIEAYFRACRRVIDTARGGPPGNLDERLGWRGIGSLTQVNIDPDGPRNNSNLFDTGNRDDALIWETGPEWTSPIFSQSELRAVGYAGQIDYGDSAIQDIDTQYVEASITQEPGAIGTIGHEARYIFQRFDYDEAGDIEDQSAFLRLSYQWSESLRIFGLVGADNDFEEEGSSALDEFRWETGFATELGPSDTLEAAVGERFYGTTWRATWNRIRENIRARRIAASVLRVAQAWRVQTVVGYRVDFAR